MVWLHFIADFVFQSDWMAMNKSKRIWPLNIHIFVYMLCLLGFGFQFALLNGVLHWITDFFSSRVTSLLWAKQKRHWFFVVIGLDQAIHMSCLFCSYIYLKG